MLAEAMTQKELIPRNTIVPCWMGYLQLKPRWPHPRRHQIVRFFGLQDMPLGRISHASSGRGDGGGLADSQST